MKKSLKTNVELTFKSGSVKLLDDVPTELDTAYDIYAFIGRDIGVTSNNPPVILSLNEAGVMKSSELIAGAVLVDPANVNGDPMFAFYAGEAKVVVCFPNEEQIS